MSANTQSSNPHLTSKPERSGLKKHDCPQDRWLSRAGFGFEVARERTDSAAAVAWRTRPSHAKEKRRDAKQLKGFGDATRVGPSHKGQQDFFRQLIFANGRPKDRRCRAVSGSGAKKTVIHPSVAGPRGRPCCHMVQITGETVNGSPGSRFLIILNVSRSQRP